MRVKNKIIDIWIDLQKLHIFRPSPWYAEHCKQKIIFWYFLKSRYIVNWNVFKWMYAWHNSRTLNVRIKPEIETIINNQKPWKLESPHQKLFNLFFSYISNFWDSVWHQITPKMVCFVVHRNAFEWSGFDRLSVYLTWKMMWDRTLPWESKQMMWSGLSDITYRTYCSCCIKVPLVLSHCDNLKYWYAMFAKE